MAKLTITRGLQASGKSTWAAQQGVKVVTKDDIRAEMHIKEWNYDVEKEVLRKRDFLISQALSKGEDVISADTNLSPKHETQLRAIANKYKAEFEVKEFFDVPVWECVRRNEGRDELTRVPEKAIWENAERYLTPEQMIPSRHTPQLFVDLDGVLADFDGWVEENLGIMGNRENELPEFWTIFRAWDKAHPDAHCFYQFKPLPEAKEMWEKLKPYSPIILTGTAYSISNCTEDKRAWVRDYIDPEAKIIHTRGKDKFRWGVPGDVLIDDWVRYQSLWEEMGGKWILHTTPKDTLAKVKEVLG